MTEPIKLSPAARADRTVADATVLRLRRLPGGDTIAALNREDWEVFTANFAPDIEYVMARRGGASAWAGADDVYVGPGGVKRFHLAWAEDWGRLEHEPIALYDLGDRVVFLAEMRGAGRASGAALSQRYGSVTDLDTRRGLTTRVRFFLDWDEALREAGVAAQ